MTLPNFSFNYFHTLSKNPLFSGSPRGLSPNIFFDESCSSNFRTRSSIMGGGYVGEERTVGVDCRSSNKTNQHDNNTPTAKEQ